MSGEREEPRAETRTARLPPSCHGAQTSKLGLCLFGKCGKGALSLKDPFTLSPLQTAWLIPGLLESASQVWGSGFMIPPHR